MRVHVAILTALPQERDAICEALKQHGCASPSTYAGDRGRRYKIYSMRTGSQSGHGRSLRIAVCPITKAGPIHAVIGTFHMLSDLAPTLTILCGIAGCMSNDADLALGDVVLGDEIYDIVLGKLQGGKTLPEWKTHKCDPSLLRDIEQWIRKSQWASAVKAKRPSTSGRRKPVAKIGVYLSGNSVLADEQRKEELRRRTPSRKLMAIEMEAAGVKAVLDEHHEHNSFLLIKAFSDWAGDDKSDSGPNRDRWHSYACATSAAFTVKMIADCIGEQLPTYRPLVDVKLEFDRKSKAALGCYLESHPDLPAPFRATANAIFESSITEILHMTETTAHRVEPDHTDRVFRAHIARGHQFLLRARPVFGMAKHVVAFSVDTVSTFWMAEQMKQQVREYIKCQCGGKHRNDKVIRTFVFSNPHEAHAYARRLDFHAERFPNTFLCSAEHYRRLLREVIATDETAAAKWMNRDFALLRYSNKDAGDSEYFAELEGEELAVRGIRPSSDVLNGVRIQQVRKLCQQMVTQCKTPGVVRSIAGVPVLKWKTGIWDDRSRWAKILNELFEERTADIWHVVGFRAKNHPDYATFRRSLTRIMNGLRSDAAGKRSLVAKHGIKGIALATRIEYGELRPEDGVTRGRLNYASGDVPNDAFILRMADEDSLTRFLADPEHTKLRIELFKEMASINPELHAALESRGIETVDDLARLDGGRKEIYEALETAAGLWRVDLRNSELLEELVAASPKNF